MLCSLQSVLLGEYIPLWYSDLIDVDIIIATAEESLIKPPHIIKSLTIRTRGTQGEGMGVGHNTNRHTDQ